jgi:hypothetical protein
VRDIWSSLRTSNFARFTSALPRPSWQRAHI